MARPFSYPEVQELETGGVVMVTGKAREVARKVNAYAARSNKQFEVEKGPTGERICGECPGLIYTAFVTRMPDPEPDVA